MVIRGGVSGCGGEERKNWMKTVKRYNLPVIKEISTRNIMYNMINIVNTAVLYMKLVKRINSEILPQEKEIFSISSFSYLYAMMDVH